MKRRRAHRRISTPFALMAAASIMPLAARASEPDSAAQTRGAAVFGTYCALCHGTTGKGDGRAAALQKTRPADLTASCRSDDYRLRIIRDGGTAMSRSDNMPAWGGVLSEQQISDLVAYLRLIGKRHSNTAASDSHRVSGGTQSKSRREVSQ